MTYERRHPEGALTPGEHYVMAQDCLVDARELDPYEDDRDTVLAAAGVHALLAMAGQMTPVMRATRPEPRR